MSEWLNDTGPGMALIAHPEVREMTRLRSRALCSSPSYRSTSALQQRLCRHRMTQEGLDEGLPGLTGAF